MPWINLQGNSATATVTQSGGVITGVTVTAGGARYTNDVEVTITGGSGAGAVATATVVAGAITAVTISNGGSSYTSPTISFGYPRKATVSNASGTRIITALTRHGLPTIRLEGTVLALTSPNELRFNTLSRNFIGISNRGTAQIGSNRPVSGMLYPRKI